LTLEEFAVRLAEVRAHYRKTGELTQDRVCMNMLATRCEDLHLNRCRTGPSRIQDGGTGLFATRDIRAGELITLYPGDALLYWKDGREARSTSKRVCSGVVFGAHIPMGERDADRVTSADARAYEGYWLSRLMDLESLQRLLGKVKALKRAGGAVSGAEFGIRNAG
jgi:hypothetical protein